VNFQTIFWQLWIFWQFLDVRAEEGLQKPTMVKQAINKNKADDVQKTARQIRQEAAEARLRAAAHEDADNKEITLSALA